MRPEIGARIRPTPIVPLDPCDERSVEDLENQQRVTSWPYYSTVKFIATRSGDSGSYVYTMALDPGGLRAFGYALREQKQAAGYTAADGVASAADTNIITKNQTISGQYVEIRGLAFQWHPVGQNVENGVNEYRPLDFQFVGALNRIISCEIGLNGDEQTYKLGTIGMVPGAGGMRGGAPALSGLPFLGGANSQPFGQNGWETRSNFFRIPEGMIWKRSDEPDGNLNVIFRQQQTFAMPASGNSENQAKAVNVAASATVAGYTYPPTLVAELKVFLIGQVIGGRSRVS